jgi:hypothetical protein
MSTKLETRIHLLLLIATIFLYKSSSAWLSTVVLATASTEVGFPTNLNVEQQHRLAATPGTVIEGCDRLVKNSFLLP